MAFCEPFFLLFNFFFHWAYFISNKLFQIFGCLYLGQKTAGEATFASPVGPRHTYQPTPKRSCEHGCATPFCAQEQFKTVKSFSISGQNKYPITPLVTIIILDEVEHFITDFIIFLEYFPLSNGNTDRQVITLCTAL